MTSYVIARMLNYFSTTTTSSETSSLSENQRILVLISGSGTNLQALISAAPKLPANIIHVVSNRKNAYGLERARLAGIPTSYHNLTTYKSQGDSGRKSYDADLAKLILSHEPDLVVCAGWMHILSSAVLNPLEAAGVDIINLHPALPGCFDGKDAIARAWAAFQAGKIEETGVMIHHVVRDVDRGEPIVVRKVDMRQGESLVDLEARIHVIEHEAIVEGTRIVLEQRKNKTKML